MKNVHVLVHKGRNATLRKRLATLPSVRNAISSPAKDQPGVHSLQPYKSNLASTLGSLNPYFVPSSNSPVGRVNHRQVDNVGPNQTVNESATIIPHPQTSPSVASTKGGLATTQRCDAYNSTCNQTTTSTSSSPSNSSLGSVNLQPVANVGPNQTVNDSATVVLLGIASDPDPNSKISYSWKQIAGPVVALKGNNTTTPTFVAPSNTPPDTELKFTLRAIDDKGVASTNPAVVTIKVKHVCHHSKIRSFLPQEFIERIGEYSVISV